MTMASGLGKSVFAMSNRPVHTRPDITTYPLFGVCTAGVHLSRNPAFGREAWYFPAFAMALKDMGVEFLVDHYFELQPASPGVDNKRRTKEKLSDLIAFLEKHNIQYIWNLERANWRESFEWEKGNNLFSRPGGLHYFRPPEEILEIFKRHKHLVGVCYDEIEHMQMNYNMSIRRGHQGYRPALADTTGMDITQAYTSIYEKAKEIRDYHDRYKVDCLTEFVWPNMHHIFARAGWVISSKLLKEGWNPIVIAMSLGSAIQYEHKGCEFYLTPDLWFCGHYPGHSVNSLKSALVAAHWVGATKIYVENLDFVNVINPVHDPVLARGFDYTTAQQGRHHPDAAGVWGSLVSYLDEDTAELTPYGQAAGWYAREYRPANPRGHSWRQARCKVAIVRFPDSCWGWPEDASPLRARLLGAKNLKPTPETEAWFKIWHLLSNGTIPDNGISFHSRYIKPSRIEEGMQWGPRFFCPMPPVLVFDHRVGDEHPDYDFRGAEVLFLTGVSVTPSTRKLLTRFVKNGKTCIALVNLAPFHIRQQYDRQAGGTQTITDGSGVWILTEDFADAKVKQAVKPYLPPNDEMQFLFGDKSVVLKMVDNDPDKISVTVKTV